MVSCDSGNVHLSVHQIEIEIGVGIEIEIVLLLLRNNGYGTNKTADYAVQPFSPDVETALHWTEPLHAAPTYHQFTWSPEMIAFESGT